MQVVATGPSAPGRLGFGGDDALQRSTVVANLLLLVLGLGWFLPKPDLILNVTPSMPYGLYRVQTETRLGYGDRVVFPVPPAVRRLVFGRRWLPRGSVLLKPIAGLAGDRICLTENSVFINGRRRGPVLRVDRQRLPLPRLRGCFTVLPDEIFTLSTQQPTSFDGRYYGTTPRTAVRGIATPLWTFSR